jgi:hypothetical protein
MRAWLSWVKPHGWLGPAQPEKKEKKKIFFKNYLKKSCDFPQIFHCILINIGLYFYTVKIQIQY